MKEWGKFTQIYTIRNALVHGYGGLVDSIDINKVEKALTELKIEDGLVGYVRIRLSPKNLINLCSIVEDIICKLDESTQQS
jgi:hypothetical protein